VRSWRPRHAEFLGGWGWIGYSRSPPGEASCDPRHDRDGVALSRQFRGKEHAFIGLGTGDRAFIFAVGIPTVAAQLATERGVDFCLPYAAGELLARVRERGTIELDYGEREVRVTGRVAPALAGELAAAAAAG
jgi:hypothetical protein